MRWASTRVRGPVFALARRPAACSESRDGPAHKESDELRVSLAHKLHNARAILFDLRSGADVWSRPTDRASGSSRGGWSDELRARRAVELVGVDRQARALLVPELEVVGCRRVRLDVAE